MTKLNWPYLRWRYRKGGLRIKRSIYRHLYRDNNPETNRSILVTGTARSGTTWVGDILASQLSSRILFEPFNPDQVEHYHDFNYFQYMRGDEQNEALEGYCRNVFSGRISHRWIDRQVSELRPQNRIVKAVRANLLLKWLSQHFPDVPQIFVIRHPCAVVSSWKQLGWSADKDLAAFLDQPQLIRDYLDAYHDFIFRDNSNEEKIAIVWCISNLVPLLQSDNRNIDIIFYENLCVQAEIEIPKLFKAINCSYESSVYNYINKPSTTARPYSAIVTGMDKVSAWKNYLTKTQIERVLSIVEVFGLSYLYEDSNLPTT